MFENPGGKVRVLAKWFFGISIVGAVFMVLPGTMYFEAGGWALLIAAVVEIFLGWIGAIVMLALADAAEGATRAAYNTDRLLELLETEDAPQTPKFSQDRIPTWQRVEMEKEAKRSTAPVATNIDGSIPAWQRIEMEKEAAAKAENK